MDHHQHEHNYENKNALRISFFLISIFMTVEVVGGLWTNSLALLSDAGHMFSDAASLGLSFLAVHFGSKKPNDSKTFGYKRFEILAAFINGLALVVISLFIIYEAYERFMDPPDVAGYGMLSIAAIGLIINLVVVYILMKGNHHDNLNVKSALLHVIGDLLGSIGAILAAVIIIWTGWGYADPLASVIVAILILISGWRVTWEAIHVLMEGTPQHISISDIKVSLESLTQIKGVHDLHVWSITSGYVALSCHIVVEPGSNYQGILNQASDQLRRDFNINHTTIQIEEEPEHCDGCN